MMVARRANPPNFTFHPHGPVYPLFPAVYSIVISLAAADPAPTNKKNPTTRKKTLLLIFILILLLSRLRRND
jgi:hypothetical protein